MLHSVPLRPTSVKENQQHSTGYSDPSSHSVESDINVIPDPSEASPLPHPENPLFYQKSSLDLRAFQALELGKADYESFDDTSGFVAMKRARSDPLF